MIEIGKKAINFCLPNQDEIDICLRDLKGKWVILYFYPKDNTPGCSTEACNFTEDLSKFEELNAVILGVSPDSPKKHRNFIQKKDLKITLLSDEEKKVLQEYGVWQLKKMCGKEYMGVVRTTYLINPEGNVVNRWDKVRVKGHVEQVRERLKKENVKGEG
jgi:peroxiredoxin Q/BCP